MATEERVGQAVADRITEAMEHAGIKRQRLAALAGIPRETLARKLERAPQTLTLSEVARLADALEVTFEELAFGVEVLA